MRLQHIDTILLVEDLDVSRRFYAETLGLEILHDWQTMLVFKDHLALLQVGELLPREEARKFTRSADFGQGSVVIYLQSQDLDACYQDLLAQGVAILHPILSLPWERIFRISDPDHYVIEIGEPH